VIVGQIIFSTGMGMGMSPATNSIMGSVPVSKAGIGSAMNDTTRQLGGALGVAVLGTFLNNTYIQGIEGLSNNQIIATLLPAEAIEAISKSIQAAHIIAAQITVPAVAEVITQTANRGFVDGMNNAMLIGAGIMLATSLLTLAILPNQVRRPEEPAEEEARDVALEPGADGMIPVPVPGD
jgi:hypothetical protein